jgi:hypothetical protein
MARPRGGLWRLSGSRYQIHALTGSEKIVAPQLIPTPQGQQCGAPKYNAACADRTSHERGYGGGVLGMFEMK